MSTQVATGLPIVAIELQAAATTPFTALTDSQWSYLAGSVTPLNPTISPDPYPMGRLRSCTIQRGKQQALNRFEAATLTAVLDNRDGKLDPNNTSSPFYPFVQAESRLRVRAWYNRVLLGQTLCNDTTLFQVVNATVGTVTSSPSPRLTNTTYAPFGSLKLTCNVTGGNIVVNDFIPFNFPITPWDDSKGCPVVPGETVTAVASYQAGSTGRACQTSVGFYTSAGVFVSEALSGGVTDNSSSWTDDSVTAVVPPGAGYAIVGHVITSVANGEIHSISAIGFWGGGDTHLIQANMVPGQPATLGGAGKMAIDRFYGYLDGDTLGYKLGYDATLTITATDAFKKFNSFDARDYFALQTMGFGPATYMRFDEPANTVFLSDISGSGFFGQIGAGVTTGVSPGTPPAAVPMYSTSNNCLALNGTNTASIELINSSFVGQTLLAGSGPWTFMAFVKCPALPSNFWPIFSQGTDSSGTPLLRVQINSSGNLQVVYANGTVFSVTPSSVNLCDGSWHFVVAEVESIGGAVTVYIDGGAASSAGLGVSPSMLGGDFYIGIDTNGFSVAFSGDLDECAVFNSKLTAANVSALQSARIALRGNTAPAAVNSLLTAVNWGLGFLDQTTGAYAIGPLVDINRTTLLDVLNNKITVTDYGAFFIRPDGQAEYLTGQFVAGNTTVAATFSDVNDSNYGWQNIPFDAIQRQQDEQLVYNDWINTWNGDLEIPSPSQVIEISTPTSIATFGAQKQQQTLYSDTLGDAIKLTQWLNGHFSNPQTRFPLLEVNLKAWPGAAPQALARELMDYVAIVQTPMGLSAMTFHPLIIHIEDTIGADFTWTVRFILDALDAG